MATPVDKVFSSIKVLQPNGKSQSLTIQPDNSIQLDEEQVVFDTHPREKSPYSFKLLADGNILITATTGETLVVKLPPNPSQPSLTLSSIDNSFYAISMATISTQAKQSLLKVHKQTQQAKQAEPEKIEQPESEITEQNTQLNQERDAPQVSRIRSSSPELVVINLKQQVTKEKSLAIDFEAQPKPTTVSNQQAETPFVPFSVDSTEVPEAQRLIIQTQQLIKGGTVKLTANLPIATDDGLSIGQFTVDLGVINNTGNAIIINYSISGTATPDLDYTALSGLISIPNGQQTTVINVQTINDALFESNETVTATLTNSNNSLFPIDMTPASVTIVDKDSEPGQHTATVTANDASAAETGPDNGQFTIDLGVVNNTGNSIALNYNVTGTATAGNDFTPLSGMVTIPNGQQTATIDLIPVDDGLFESNETVNVTLTGSSNAAVVVDATPATVTITDNDSNPGQYTAAVTANDASAAETGPDNGQFTVDLGVINNTGNAITLNYNVAGTATAGNDFTSLSGMVTIPNGQQTATIDLVPVDDGLFESNETVNVTLTGSSNAAVVVDDTPATVTITDNEIALDLDGNDSSASGSSFTTIFTEVGTGGPSVPIADVDASINFIPNPTSATISLTNQQTGDILLDSTAGGLPGGIVASAFMGGVITLNGMASAANYASAIALIHFQNTGDDPSIRGASTTRTINVSVTDGMTTSNTAISTINISAANDAPTITINSLMNVTGQIPTFSGENTISNTQDGAYIVAPGDLDGDGDLDVVASASNEDTIVWFANDGMGSFGAENNISTTQDRVIDVTTADLDGDGDLDVLSASFDDDTIAWFANDGAGNFSAENTISNTQDGAHGVTVADLDGDNDLDVLSASSTDNTIAWFTNDGMGNFGAENVISNTQLGAYNVAAADLDGDGDQDVLTASRLEDIVAWFANDGMGNFGAENVISNSQDEVYSVIAADIDGDNDLDVLSASRNDDTVAWFTNDGMGNFGAENVISNSQDGAIDVTTGDIDGDGDLDVLSGSDLDDTIAWFVNNGMGVFGSANVINNMQDGVGSVPTADLDRDGDLDVVSASLFDDTVAWFENQSLLSTRQNTALTLSTANNNTIAINDVDANSVTTILTVSNGVLTATASGSAVITTNGTSSIQITGNVADTNATLNGLTYTPNLNYFSTQANPEAIVISINDNGNNGTGGAMMDMETVNIRVAPTAPPIVIDLDGDGVEFIGLSTNYQFDMNGDTNPNYTAWASADDGILVYDHNDDKQINTINEFQFANYLADAKTDLAGLAFFDSNHNGQLDLSDEAFRSFHIWQDKDLNGKIDAGEWTSLTDSNIISISLISDNVKYHAAEGNVTVHGTTSAEFIDGSVTLIADAEFTYLPDQHKSFPNNPIIDDTDLFTNLHCYADMKENDIQIDNSLEYLEEFKKVEHINSIKFVNILDILDTVQNSSFELRDNQNDSPHSINKNNIISFQMNSQSLLNVHIDNFIDDNLLI